MKNDTTQADAFIARWQGQEGGQERANYALFLSELCDVLGVARPAPAAATTAENDYVFERAVKRHAADGAQGAGRIDLYKRGCFVLEAKQSRQKPGVKKVDVPHLPGMEPANRGVRDASRTWDVLMLNARRQAEGYARALPNDHGWPPFILVCDVGHVIETYADFSGQGKNYAQFPDRQSFRVYLEDLRRPDIRDRLARIWTDPKQLDPARETTRVTRAIAERLAAVSKALEDSGHDAEDVAMFLMRCLFTMFACSPGIGLLPERGFRDLLQRCEADPSRFVHLVGQLWEAMDTGGFAFALDTKVRRFNGEFFRARRPATRPRRDRRTPRRRVVRLEGGRSLDFRHAAGTGPRQGRAPPARRALHATGIRGTAGRRHGDRTAARRLGAGALHGGAAERNARPVSPRLPEARPQRHWHDYCIISRRRLSAGVPACPRIST